MHIGKNNPKLEYTMRTENENKILIETHEEKDLGVWITNDLKHERQVIQGLTLAMCPLARTHFLGGRASSGHNN